MNLRDSHEFSWFYAYWCFPWIYWVFTNLHGFCEFKWSSSNYVVSMNLHGFRESAWFSWIYEVFMDLRGCHEFTWFWWIYVVVMNLQGFHECAWFSWFRAWMFKTWQNGMERPAAPIEAFARFQAGFLSSEDFHHRFSWFLMDVHDFGPWVLRTVRYDLLPLQKLLLDSRLASRLWGL